MKKITIPLIIVLALVLVAVGGIFGYNFVQNDINGNRNTKCEYNLIIDDNDFEYEVGKMLKDNDIIKSDIVWTNWMSKHYPNFAYINGEYKMTSSMTYEEIAQKLQNPDVSHKRVSVCIPEGYNVMEIAKTLDENQICSADDFLNACRYAKDYDFDFLDSVPNNSLIAYQLEGFLFPATYDFKMNSNAADIVDIMLDVFDQHITNEMEAFCQNNNMTMFEFVNLASIVQEEALSYDSAENIASVFINRINKGAKLQSDVTYFYAADLRDKYGFSQQVYDAYYTYRCDGLPAGPITNCGDEIFKAVATHQKTDYLYFFSDLKGDFHFASTYDEFASMLDKYPWK